MLIERLKRYSFFSKKGKPDHKGAWVHYQDDCRFYLDDFQMRDQVMNGCESIFDAMQILMKHDEEVIDIFAQAQFVLVKEQKSPDDLQEEANEKRITDWIYKKIIRRGNQYVDDSGCLK